MTATAERPFVELDALRVYASREGDRVTGRAEFPFETCGRSQVSIDYRSARPDGSTEGGVPSKADVRAAERQRLVDLWRDLIKKNPGTSKTALAERVTSPTIKCSPASLRRWEKVIETEGADGLRDRYTGRATKVLALAPDTATNAVLICAWWAYRIGNVDSIGTHMMHVAAGLIDKGYDVADVIATIDCYYSWPSDRRRYRFKPFSKWVRYDFERWLYRAADENDYRRAIAGQRRERTPLRRSRTIHREDVPDAKTRKRETLNGSTRRAIHDLAQPSNQANVSPPAPRQSAKDRAGAVQTAKWLKRLGHSESATAVAATIDTGITAIAANRNPQSIAEALGTLDNAYRTMLLCAAQGDTTARDQAVATMPLWWNRMPQSVRNNIDFKIDAFRKDHPQVGDRTVARRKLDMLLPAIRDRRSGAQRLGVAMRITA